jgi:hypothetical protein
VPLGLPRYLQPNYSRTNATARHAHLEAALTRFTEQVLASAIQSDANNCVVPRWNGKPRFANKHGSYALLRSASVMSPCVPLYLGSDD